MTYRQRANGILALAFVCFALIFWWWYGHGGNFYVDLIFFIIQSALIGSIADWFAVTALFEKPLGFPYHTELIHRHRDKLIDGMSKVVSEKLLRPHMWEDKLQDFSLIEKLQQWISSESGQEKVRIILYHAVEKVYEYAKRGESQEAVANHIRAYLKRQPLMLWMQNHLIALLENPDGKIFNGVIHVAKGWIQSEAFENVLTRAIDQWIEDTRRGSHLLSAVNKFTGLIESRKIAHDIAQAVVVWLDKWETADSERRQWLCHQLEMQLYAMQGQLTSTVQSWQDQFIDTLPIEMWIDGIVRSSSEYFSTGVEGQEKVMNFVERELRRYVAYCGHYPEIKQWLDGQIRRACAVILEHEHALIGVAVHQVLTSFDKKEFNNFLESKVGEDLAWIRINGALVGGTIGFFVFIFLRVFYGPYVAPLIRGLFS